MSALFFRASMIGKIMTEPRSKSDGPLSQGAKSAIRDMAAQSILAIDFEIAGKEIEKGNECEGESIALLNRVRGLALAKNTERRNDGYVTGECDLYDQARSEGYDLKTAWSAATFPILADDIGGAQRALYEWQCRAYMALWDAKRWHVAYTLVNTPERLIRFEPVTMHFFDHIPEHMRLTVWTIERDAAKEAEMRAKVKHARVYFYEVLEEFTRTHKQRTEWTDEGADTFPPEPPPEKPDRAFDEPVATMPAPDKHSALVAPNF
jgi:hypothetical protein